MGNVLMDNCVTVIQSRLQCSSTSSQVYPLRFKLFQWYIFRSHPFQSNLCDASILNGTQKPLISLYITQIFYTDFRGVTTAINLEINCMASDNRYLRNFGAIGKILPLHTLMEGTSSF